MGPRDRSSAVDRPRIERFAVVCAVGPWSHSLRTVHGDGSFCASIEQQLSATFKKTITRACDAPHLHDEFNADLAEMGGVFFQPQTTRRLGSHDQSHRLRTLALPNSAVNIFFSHEDLSYALLDRPWCNTDGYRTDSARIILRQLPWRAIG